MNGPSADKIQNLFSEISKSYDTANDTITFGLARSWRRKLVVWSEVKEGDKILDIATGTGDLAFDFSKKTNNTADIIGIDFCQPMLDIAVKKSSLPNIKFLWGDACQLQYPDQSFDIVSISYGLRNVERFEDCVKEMYRVLKPGGRLMILETGSKDSGFLSPFINFYSNYVMPHLGGFISGKKSAYEYLSSSSAQFPSGKNLLGAIHKSAPFSVLQYKKVMGGASFIYKLIK